MVRMARLSRSDSSSWSASACIAVGTVRVLALNGGRWHPRAQLAGPISAFRELLVPSAPLSSTSALVCPEGVGSGAGRAGTG